MLKSHVSCYLCASGQNMRWTCRQNNFKLVTFWTFLSDFWTIATHPGLVTMSAVLLGIFQVGFFCCCLLSTARTMDLFLDEGWDFFSKQCFLQAAGGKNWKTARKVTKFGSKKQKCSQAVCLVEATTQALWHSALQPEHSPVGFALSCSQYLAHSEPQEPLHVGVPLWITWPQRLFSNLTSQHLFLAGLRNTLVGNFCVRSRTPTRLTIFMRPALSVSKAHTEHFLKRGFSCGRSPELPTQLLPGELQLLFWGPLSRSTDMSLSYK